MNGKKYNIQCKNGIEFVFHLSVLFCSNKEKMFKGVIFPFALVRGSFSKMVPKSYSPQIVASVGA